MIIKAIQRLFRIKPQVIVLGALIAVFCFGIYKAIYSPEVSFIFQNSKAKWISAPYALETFLHPIDHASTTSVSYQKEFFINEKPKRALFSVKAMRAFKLYVNDSEVPIDTEKDSNWKKEKRIEISSYLKSGNNAIVAEVQNPRGPALLCVQLDGSGFNLVTDRSWQASMAGVQAQAIIADATLAFPQAFLVNSTAYVFQMMCVTILQLFFISILVFFLFKWLIEREIIAAKSIPLVLLLSVSALWFLLFFKWLQISPDRGFDASDHIDYIGFILYRGTLPFADQGYEMFHPPLYYWMSASILKFIHKFLGLEGKIIWVRPIAFLSGLGNIWLTYFAAKKLFANDFRKRFFAVLTAGMIPMNLYLSAFITNEPLHTFLASLIVVIILYMLDKSQIQVVKILMLGTCVGLALLTKITIIIILPFVVYFTLYKAIALDKLATKKVIVLFVAFVISVLTVAGWYYVRNWIYIGKPVLVGISEETGWQFPGFRTLAYYLKFGHSILYPYFSGFVSFWDGLYSTFWGDGSMSGKASILDMFLNPWNYSYMAIVFILALPATIIMGYSIVKTTIVTFVKTIGSETLQLIFLWTIIWVVEIFFLYFSLERPAYSATKSFYGLLGIVPISVLSAYGFSAIDQFLVSKKLFIIHLIFVGWLGTLISAVYLSALL